MGRLASAARVSFASQLSLARVSIVGLAVSLLGLARLIRVSLVTLSLLTCRLAVSTGHTLTNLASLKKIGGVSDDTPLCFQHLRLL